METQQSVVIDRPIAAVFEYTTNNLAEWSITCVEEEVLEEVPDGDESQTHLRLPYSLACMAVTGWIRVASHAG